MQPDQETKNILTEQEKLTKLVEHDGWAIFKSKVDMAILDLQNIYNVAGNTAEEKVRNMDARIMAVEVIFGVMKDTLGTANQFKGNKIIAHEPDTHIVIE